MKENGSEVRSGTTAGVGGTAVDFVGGTGAGFADVDGTGAGTSVDVDGTGAELVGGMSVDVDGTADSFFASVFSFVTFSSFAFSFTPFSSFGPFSRNFFAVVFCGSSRAGGFLRFEGLGISESFV
jgi:hypothetical protein